MNLMNKTGIGRMVALHSFQGIINSSGAALLTVDGMNPKDFLKGGQALERIWLAITQQGLAMQPMTAITQQGLAMQPMTAITLFWLRWQIEGEKSFAKKTPQAFTGCLERISNPISRSELFQGRSGDVVQIWVWRRN